MKIQQARKNRTVAVGLFVIPILLGLVWGTQFEDSAYITLRYARQLSQGAGLSYNAAAGTSAPILRAPLFAAVLALIGSMGGALPAAAWAVSVLGWGTLALMALRLAQCWRKPLGGVIAAVLIVFSPVFIQTLGAETSWTLALGWGAGYVFSAKRRHTWLAWVLIPLLLLTHFSLETAVLSLFLVSMRRWREKRPFAPESLSFVMTIVGWGWLALSRQWSIPALFAPDWAMLTAIVQTAFLFLAGLGIEALAAWLIDNNRIRLEPAGTTAVIGIAVGGILLIVQVGWWMRAWEKRPFNHRLESEIAAWIQADAHPNASLLATERIAFLTGLPAFYTDSQLLTDADYQSIVLSEHPPAYLLLSDSADWLRMTRMAWFQERYAPLQAFPSPTMAEPMTLWGCRDSAFKLGQRDLLQAISPAGIEVVGRKFEGETTVSGKEKEATLFLRARWPLSEPFYVRLHLDATADGKEIVQNQQPAPSATPLADWQMGTVIAETFSLTVPEGLSYGAYRVSASFHSAADGEAWPFYQDNDANPLDRVLLGYLAVPWMQPVEDDAAPVMARFDEQIHLNAFALGGDWNPGGAAALTLYWEALELPAQTYFLFIHLQDEAGNLVVNINERPTGGAFPMEAWFPGAIIRDDRPLPLPSNLPSGRYRLSVGLFDLDSGERLPLRDGVGNEVVAGALLLTEVVVGQP
ncbi:MAG: hypothetical protein GY803_02520 [Chloroflexi bacterium]|nr:hypothetical protein [Chloroflexota bacterium]